MKNKLKELRTMQGLTISSVADAVKVTHQSLSYIERGLQLPSVKTALKLARFFKVPVDELFILN